MGVALENCMRFFSQLALANVRGARGLLHVRESGDRLQPHGHARGPRGGQSRGGRRVDRELRRYLASDQRTLPEREKTVVTLYYYEGLTLAEIGNDARVTESRVQSDHTRSRCCSCGRSWRVSGAEGVPGGRSW